MKKYIKKPDNIYTILGFLVVLFSFLVILNGTSPNNQLPVPLPEYDTDSNGNLTMNYALDIPSGTGNIAPKLGLNYHSQSGSNILGKGWVLSGVPEIQRENPQNSLQIYKFSHNYMGSLFQKSGKTFGSRSESFTNWSAEGSIGNPDYWIETGSDGTKRVYGLNSEDKSYSEDFGSTWIWHLTYEEDIHGNRVDYKYFSHENSKYISEISYANGSRRIEFIYSHFTDDKPSYALRNSRKDNRKLDRIRFYSKDTLSHSYEFTYKPESATSYGSLVLVKLEKKPGSGNLQYAPLEFTTAPMYSTKGIFHLASQSQISGPNGTLTSLTDPLFELIKAILFNNLMNGITGSHKRSQLSSFDRSMRGNLQSIHRSASNLSRQFPQRIRSGIKRNLGTFQDHINSIGDIQDQPFAPQGSQQNHQNFSTEMTYRYPLDGDQRQTCDIGVLTCICKAFVPACPVEVVQVCAEFVFLGGLHACNHGITSPGPISLPTDLNGDGITEYSRFLGQMDDPGIHLRTTDKSGQFPETSLHGIQIRYNTYFDVADMDGDGRSDFAFQKDGRLHVAYSNGDHLASPVRFEHVKLRNMPGGYGGYHAYKSEDYFMDWNSDGRADFVHVDGRKIHVYLSTGRNFSGEIVYEIPEHLHSIHVVGRKENLMQHHRMSSFSDTNGDGHLEHVLLIPKVTGEGSQELERMKSEHLIELNNKKAEFLHMENGLRHSLENPDPGYIPIYSGKLRSADRDDYEKAMGGEITINTALIERMEDSLKAETIGPVIGAMIANHQNLENQEMERLKGQEITVADFDLIITYFNHSNNSVHQTTQVVNHVGMVGSNFLIDVNSDGLPDLVTIANEAIQKNPFVVNSSPPQQLFENSSIYVRYNRGDSFDSEIRVSNLSTPYSSEFSGYQFTDVDADGEIDLVISHRHHSSFLDVYFGDGRGNFTKHASSFPLGHHIDLSHDKIQSFRFEDSNFDAKPDLYVEYGRDFKSKVFYAPNNLPEGTITKITDGTGGVVTIDYKLKKDFPQAVSNTNRSYENGLPNLSPTYLVERVTKKNTPNSPTVESSYEYTNHRFKPGNRETATNLGFETVSERQYVNSSLKSTTTTHYSRNLNYAGMTDWQEVKDANGNLIQRTEQQYTLVHTTPHSKTVLPTRTLVRVYKSGSIIDTKETLTEYNTAFAYNPSKATENWNGRTTVTEVSYTSQPSVGIAALPIEQKVFINGELVSHSQNAFDSGKLVSKSNLVSPGKWYTEYYSYDSLGNVIAQSNNLGRNLQYTYGGTTGSQLIEVKNPLGQTTTTEYDPVTDQEIKTIDANGIETTTNYDPLGRPISVYLDGTRVQTTSYEWTGTKYITTTTLHSRDGDSWTKTTTDKEGRELKSESLVFDNITSTRETEYDELGRVHRTSHEYLTGETPTWTTTTYYTQSEDIEERPKRIVSNTGEVSELSYTAFTTTITVSKDGELLRTEILENDAFGQLKKKTVQDKAIEYTYNAKGQLIQVKDPGTGLTTMEYDFAGNKIKQTDQNSGDTTYTYNIAGELISQTDARGITQTFNLDGLGRITKIQTNTPEPPTTFTYDTANSLNGSNTIGKLTRITDVSGTTELAYDNRGNSIVEKRTIDDLTLLFQRTYDDLNRVKTLIYPEGTKLTNMYTPSGKLLTILMDSHDGSSRNHPLVTYTGPIQRDGKIYLQRKTGNNVEMDIEVDPLYRRPKSIQTKLSDGHIEQKLSYQYDKKGNITKVTDHFHEDRNQEFEYDAVNRITKAKGKYGEETYSYHKNGNLLKRGQFNLAYNNPNHIHAVTRADSPQTGLINYQYDSIGNLIQRNGDQYKYNATGKLQEITTEGGDKFTYTYDHSGNRIKKHLQNANTTTYSFGDLYEIHRAPGEPEKHTMYITGMQGDKVSQYSRPDALLRTDAFADGGQRTEKKYAGVLINAFWDTPKALYMEIERDMAMVYHGVPSISLFKDSGVPKPIAKIFFWLFCLTLLLYYAVKLKSENPTLVRITSAIATYAFFFASGYGCTPLFYGGAQTEEGIPPWLLGLGIPGNTPSVSDAPGNYGGGGTGAVGGGQSTARIPGMFFYYPDHLGSITMITDGHGQVLAGGERGGKSHISYRPYGEIFRTDSFGPDISKYKYTGQEEDKESGLYYYKARYYDPVIGRFAQNDSMAFPDRIQGMNRMMYVEGNPMNLTDSSGHSIDLSWFNSLVEQFIAGPSPELVFASQFVKGKGARAIQDWALVNAVEKLKSGEDDFGLGGLVESFGHTNVASMIYIMDSRMGLGKRIRDAYSKIGRSFDHSIKGMMRGMTGSVREIGRAMDGGARWLASGGNYSRNKGNDLDRMYAAMGINTNGLFMSIQKSDVGNLVTDFNQSPCSGVLKSIALYKTGLAIVLDNVAAFFIPETVVRKAIGGSNTAYDIKSCIGSASVHAWGQ